MLANGPTLLAAASGVFLIGVAASAFLERAARVDHATAFFSSAIGGAAEMVNLAERHGALVDRVALAHSLRLLVVVTTGARGHHAARARRGTDDYRPVVVPFDPAQLAAPRRRSPSSRRFAWRRTRLPNPFMMGPLLLVIALTAGGARVLLDAVLDDQRGAGPARAATSARASSRASFARRRASWPRCSPPWSSCSPSARSSRCGLAWSAGLMPATLLLACAPGGIAEMAITAKVLRVGVAFVTAAHVVRFVIVMLFTEPAYRLLARRRANLSARRGVERCPHTLLTPPGRLAPW